MSQRDRSRTTDPDLARLVRSFQREHLRYKKRGNKSFRSQGEVVEKVEIAVNQCMRHIEKFADQAEGVMRRRPEHPDGLYCYVALASSWAPPPYPLRYFDHLGLPCRWGHRVVEGGQLVATPALISRDYLSRIDQTTSLGRKRKKERRKAALAELRQQMLALELLRMAVLNVDNRDLATVSAICLHRP